MKSHVKAKLTTMTHAIKTISSVYFNFCFEGCWYSVGSSTVTYINHLWRWVIITPPRILAATEAHSHEKNVVGYLILQLVTSVKCLPRTKNLERANSDHYLLTDSSDAYSFYSDGWKDWLHTTASPSQPTRVCVSVCHPDRYDNCVFACMLAGCVWKGISVLLRELALTPYFHLA